MTDKLTKLKDSPVGVQTYQWDIIGSVTPAKYIKKRKGRGGKEFPYAETGYFVDTLNKAFNGMWDFVVVDHGIRGTHVWVEGSLVVKVPIFNRDGSFAQMQTISKQNFGGSDIKFQTETRKDTNGKTILNDWGKPKAFPTDKEVDFADDLKSAAADALKKCASMFGIAADLYWTGGEHIQEVDPTDDFVSSTETLTDKATHPLKKLCTTHNKEMTLKESGSKTWYSHINTDGSWHNEYIN